MAVRILINAKGGAASADPDLQAHVQATLQSAGLGGVVRLLDAAGIAGQCRAAVDAREDMVIVGGGDGTISLAAAELAGSDTALAILPLGTLNHFARDLGLKLDLPAAAQAIARGQVQQVDVAEVNRRIFINNSVIGLYPLLVRDREAQQQRFGRGKRFAMLVAALRTLVRFHHQRLRLRVDGRPTDVDTPLLFVGNNDYRLELPGPGTRDTLDDGKLCLFVLRSKSRAGFIGAVFRALAGRSRPDDIVRLDNVRRVIVNTRRSILAVAIDGEVVRLSPPLEYQVRPRALRVIVPSDSDASAAPRIQSRASID